MDGLPAPRLVAGLPTEVTEDLDLLAALLDTGPIGFACLDPELRLLHLNRKLAAFAAPGVDHVGRTPREVLPGMAEAFMTHAPTLC